MCVYCMCVHVVYVFVHCNVCMSAQYVCACVCVIVPFKLTDACIVVHVCSVHVRLCVESILFMCVDGPYCMLISVRTCAL